MLALAFFFANVVYIPVAGSVVNSTTSFSSSFRLINRVDHPQRVRADWIARDGNGSRENTELFDLGANETRMIASVFPFAGFPPSLGAVKFVAVTANGATDPHATIEASSVIHALRLGDGSRLTEVVPGVSEPDARTTQEIVFWPVLVPAFLPANSPRPRANYGIVNDDDQANTFRVQARFPARGGVAPVLLDENVTVPLHAMVQRQLLMPASPADDDGAIVTIRRFGSSAGIWTAYVSSIDSSTGDAVMVPALPRDGKLAVDN